MAPLLYSNLKAPVYSGDEYLERLLTSRTYPTESGPAVQTAGWVEFKCTRECWEEIFCSCRSDAWKNDHCSRKCWHDKCCSCCPEDWKNEHCGDMDIDTEQADKMAQWAKRNRWRFAQLLMFGFAVLLLCFATPKGRTDPKSGGGNVSCALVAYLLLWTDVIVEAVQTIPGLENTDYRYMTSVGTLVMGTLMPVFGYIHVVLHHVLSEAYGAMKEEWHTYPHRHAEGRFDFLMGLTALLGAITDLIGDSMSEKSSKGSKGEKSSKGESDDGESEKSEKISKVTILRSFLVGCTGLLFLRAAVCLGPEHSHFRCSYMWLPLLSFSFSRCTHCLTDCHAMCKAK